MQSESQRVGLRERYLYTQGMLGQNIIFNCINSFLSVFYTDILLIAPASASLLFLVARLWDAVNDPMMGSIADRTRTRYGKFKPYLMTFAVPIGIISVLCFTGSGLPSQWRLVYAYATYIAWGMLYTVCDIPIWAMCSVISSSEQERTVVLSWIKVGATLGAGIVLVFGIKVIGWFGGLSVAAAYWKSALVMCGAGALFMQLAAFAVQERVLPPKAKVSVLSNLQVIYRNLPLLLLILASLVSNFAGGIRTAVQLYYAKYVLLNEGLMMGIAAAAIGLMLVGMALTPLLTKRYSNKTIFIASTLGASFFHLIAFVAGYANLPLLIALLSVGVGFTGVNTIVMTALLIDTLDFANRKLGIRGEGIAFSTQTLVVKLSSAIAASLVLGVLQFMRYVPNALQTLRVMQGMHGLMFLVPALAYGLAALPILFYRLGR